MTFLDQLNLPKFDFTWNWSGGKIIKFQQSQALTLHFENFWSIVQGTGMQFSKSLSLTYSIDILLMEYTFSYWCEMVLTYWKHITVWKTNFLPIQFYVKSIMGKIVILNNSEIAHFNFGKSVQFLKAKVFGNVVLETTKYTKIDFT